MVSWFEKEVEKYSFKKVIYKDDLCTIKGVFWNNTDEQLEFYLESDDSSKSYRVFEKDIKLI